MENSYISLSIIENIEIAKSVFKMKLSANIKAKSGQFFMVKGFEDENMLPRPISLCDVDEETLTFLYLAVGRGTKLLSQKKVGEEVEVLGPLGNGFDLEVKEDDKVAIVTGGIGIAPMLNLAKNLNCKIDLYAGFRDEIYFIDEIKEYVENVYITTESGKHGYKGYITDIIKDEYSKVYSCGPNVMMKSLKSLNLNAKVYVSLESHMGCGIGACLACSCKTKKGMQRICKEGPIFDILEVEI